MNSEFKMTCRVRSNGFHFDVDDRKLSVTRLDTDHDWEDEIDLDDEALAELQEIKDKYEIDDVRRVIAVIDLYNDLKNRQAIV